VTKNPLTMIGLTPAILALGLTQDGLYEYATRVARILFACVHPDRHNGTKRLEALHFSAAFALLKNRQYLTQRSQSFRGSWEKTEGMLSVHQQHTGQITERPSAYPCHVLQRFP
jgi:hypothetical protein